MSSQLLHETDQKNILVNRLVLVGFKLLKLASKYANTNSCINLLCTLLAELCTLTSWQQKRRETAEWKECTKHWETSCCHNPWLLRKRKGEWCTDPFLVVHYLPWDVSNLLQWLSGQESYHCPQRRAASPDACRARAALLDLAGPKRINTQLVAHCPLLPRYFL